MSRLRLRSAGYPCSSTRSVFPCRYPRLQSFRIVSSVTGRLGIGVYGPALNEKGNSAGGIAALQHISHLLKLNVFR